MDSTTNTTTPTNSTVASKAIIAAGVATGIIIAVGITLPKKIRQIKDNIALGEAQLAVTLDPEHHVIVD